MPITEHEPCQTRREVAAAASEDVIGAAGPHHSFRLSLRTRIRVHLAS